MARDHFRTPPPTIKRAMQDKKQDVKGSNQSKLYNALVNSSAGKGKDVRWNFEKFLVDSRGNVVERFSSGVKPDSAELTNAIESTLAKSK